MDAKRICSRDAISWLPDEVLGSILSLLPTKQAASTSLLSKRWRYVFRLVDNLDFDDSVSLHEGEDQQARYVFPESFENFVDRTLALQCDSPINKFSLKCHVGKDDERQRACVSSWISNVAGRRVLEAELRIKDMGIHYLPPQLFASKTMVKLSLGAELYLGKLPSCVSLPSLKFLFIDTVCFEYEDFSCVLLAGCPVLEELSIRHKDFIVMPNNISSPTVKKLSVLYDAPDEVDGGSCISFDLPNLVYFEYSDCALSEYTKVNLESLVEAKLDLCFEENAEKPDVTDVMMGIRNVKILHLSSSSVEVIHSYCRYGLPVFHNLVNLSFGSFKNKRGWKLLKYLLKQSPKLETLTIQDLNGYPGVVSMPPNKVKVLHVLGYQGTVEELKHLKSLVGEFQCLTLVQVSKWMLYKRIIA
ncbi:hypothetical protein EUTSA_v10006004mg [Eutrema salsugineum]|uniref:F-box domain-containing protein n=1 Tax=Eutrema salsugineum TaxID=72664 RepID=V4L1B8_EUTSA|nr:F-box/LRR-repeat protein At3g60040 [Eutrema salsugineum]ESQ44060.1 hypothetical protein EUTSA_v10006004mg [Eutrema salsugineum]